MAVIEIKNLVKRFDTVVAVNKLSFSVPENVVFGLLGSNGAGKTTTLNMLTGLLIPEEGSINVLGMDCIKDIEKVRREIAIVPQTDSLYEDLTVYENLDFFASLYISNKKELKKRLDDMISQFKLKEYQNVRISKLSGGWKRICSIACALVSNPKILFLDEPLTGIDLHASQVIMDFIKSIKGMTVIFTTHLIKEAEEICDYVLFVDKGKKILDGTPKKISNSYAKVFGENISIDFGSMVDIDKVEKNLKKSGNKIKNLKQKRKNISFKCMDPGNCVVDIFNSLKSLRSDVVDIDIQKPSLEDIFRYLMEKKK